MSNITYHKSTIDDAELLAGLRIAFILDFTGPQPEADVANLKKILTAYFQKAISENCCISYIAKCDNEIAGTGAIVLREQPGNFKNPSGRVGYVMNMYTIPHFRKRGICTTILEKLITDARRCGITAFELHATKEGEPVYANNGFLKHNEPTYRQYFTL